MCWGLGHSTERIADVVGRCLSQCVANYMMDIAPMAVWISSGNANAPARPASNVGGVGSGFGARREKGMAQGIGAGCENRPGRNHSRSSAGGEGRAAQYGFQKSTLPRAGWNNQASRIRNEPQPGTRKVAARE